MTFPEYFITSISSKNLHTLPDRTLIMCIDPVSASYHTSSQRLLSPSFASEQLFSGGDHSYIAEQIHRFESRRHEYENFLFTARNMRLALSSTHEYRKDALKLLQVYARTLSLHGITFLHED